MEETVKSKKMTRNGKYILFGVLAAALLSIGVMMAWFTDSNTITNTFQFGNFDTEIKEEYEGLTKTQVGVTVSGNIPCYVRARVEIPTVIAPKTGEKITAKVDLKENSGWKQEADGYWYYETPVSGKNGGPSDLLAIYDSISYDKLDKGTVDRIGSEKFNITIYAETVQSENLPEGIDTAQEAFAYFEGEEQETN